MALLAALKALADEKRLKMVEMLLRTDLCVGALAKHLGVSKPAVSQHLRILRHAGLVKGEKRGYWTHYMVDREALHRTASELHALAEKDRFFQPLCLRIQQPEANITHAKEADMCDHCCQQPEKLKDKPEACTPEQIQECHGEDHGHPCTGKDCAPGMKSPFRVLPSKP